MERSFWLQRWEKNDIGFHESDTNPALAEYFKELSLKRNDRVFVPLCGKTLDIGWLLSNGCRVAGAELSEMAVHQLFEGLKITPKISPLGPLQHFEGKNIDIFAGDIFELSRDTLGLVNAIYDRAALVALPEDMRRRYTAHLMELTQRAPQLLVTYEYDQTVMQGPPFSVTNEEVNRRYGLCYSLTHLEGAEIPGGIRGKTAARENVWLLRPKP